jgi:hypothetical protein
VSTNTNAFAFVQGATLLQHFCVNKMFSFAPLLHVGEYKVGVDGLQRSAIGYTLTPKLNCKFNFSLAKKLPLAILKASSPQFI